MKEAGSTQVTPGGDRKGDLRGDEVERLSDTMERMRKERNEWRCKLVRGQKWRILHLMNVGNNSGRSGDIDMG